MTILPHLLIILKILIFCVIAIATRGTLPRYRFDQFTQLNWKHYIYIWLGYLTIMAVMHVFLL